LCCVCGGEPCSCTLPTCTLGGAPLLGLCPARACRPLGLLAPGVVPGTERRGPTHACCRGPCRIKPRTRTTTSPACCPAVRALGAPGQSLRRPPARHRGRRGCSMHAAGGAANAAGCASEQQAVGDDDHWGVWRRHNAWERGPC